MLFASAMKVAGLLSLCVGLTALTPANAENPRCPAGAVCPQPGMTDSDALPPNARPGECYTKVYVPPEFATVTERIKVRDAYDELEVVPARYEWVEERVCVKEASEELRVVPAQFAMRPVTFEAQAGGTEWQVNANPTCVAYPRQPAQDVFCLVSHPPILQTIPTQTLVKPAHVEKVRIPAQFQTIRRQKLVSPAMVRRVTIPAEYRDIQKNIKVCDGKMVWKRIECNAGQGVVSDASDTTPQTPPATALAADRD